MKTDVKLQRDEMLIAKEHGTALAIASVRKPMPGRSNPWAMGLLSRLIVALSTSIALWALVYWATTG